MFEKMSHGGGGSGENPESGISSYAETLGGEPDSESTSAESVERGESVEAGRSLGGAALSVSERLENGAEGREEGDEDEELDEMSPEEIGKSIENLVFARKFDIDKLVSRMLPNDVCDKCAFLLDYGIADAKMVAEKMIQFSPASVAEHLTHLRSRKNGEEIDVDALVMALDSAGVAANLETLVSNGVGIEELVQKMDPADIGPEQQKIIDRERGAILDKKRIGELSAKMGNGEDLTEAELRFLYETERPIRRGGRQSPDVAWSPEEAELRSEYGIEYAMKAGISVDEILDSLAEHGMYGKMYIAEHIDELIKCGASVEQLKGKLGAKGANGVDSIIEVTRLGLRGAEADSGGAELSDEDVLRRRQEVDVDLFMSRISPEEYQKRFAFCGGLSYRVKAENLDALIDRGYFGSSGDASELAWALGLVDQKSLAKNAPTIIKHMSFWFIWGDYKHGSRTKWVASCMGPNYRAQNREVLEEQDA